MSNLFTFSYRVLQDIAFEIGRLYYGIRLYDEALEFYTHSRDTVGEHHVTYHNMGLCHYSKGECFRLLCFLDLLREIIFRQRAFFYCYPVCRP